MCLNGCVLETVYAEQLCLHACVCVRVRANGYVRESGGVCMRKCACACVRAHVCVCHGV